VPEGKLEEKLDGRELDRYVKSWHKGDLTPKDSLVRMTFLEQAEELRKVMVKLPQERAPGEFIQGAIVLDPSPFSAKMDIETFWPFYEQYDAQDYEGQGRSGF